jgi:hypothetical protein
LLAPSFRGLALGLTVQVGAFDSDHHPHPILTPTAVVKTTDLIVQSRPLGTSGPFLRKMFYQSDIIVLFASE